jgi:exodeoxyribonuclease VII small subunit
LPVAGAQEPPATPFVCETLIRPSATFSRSTREKGLDRVPGVEAPWGTLATGNRQPNRTTGDITARLMAARRNDFEQSFQQLETIVKRLEGEELPLDESLQLFEEGIRLSRFCHQRLEEVEKKIELILADAKGQPRTEPFDDPDDLDEDDEHGAESE